MIRVLAFVCCFPIFSIFAQDSVSYSLSTNLQYHPHDFFFNLQFSRQKQRVVHALDLGFGINKTIFQRRFFPKMSYEFGMNFKLVDWLALQPGVRFSYSFLDVRYPKKNPFIHVTEYFAVGKVILGRKHAVVIGGGIGPAWEWKHHANLGRNRSFFMWNYVAEVGYKYVF